MATELKKYALSGEEVGSLALEEAWLESSVKPQMVKDYITAYRAHQRQWSANTQTRAEVNHSGKKPHPQKGTGRARQGYLGSPQYRGGGRVHAPRPKFEQRVKVNKKERQAVIRHVLIDRILGNSVHIVRSEGFDKPKTKRIADFLKQLELQGKRVLFLGEKVADGLEPMHVHGPLAKSMRNIPGTTFQLFAQINGYELMRSHAIFVLEPGIEELKRVLQGAAHA